MVKPSQIAELRPLKELSQNELEDVARSLMELSLNKGAHLFYRNDPSSGVYLLAKGALQITIDSEESKEIVVTVIREGEIVGEMSLFDQSRRSATAVAIEKCQLYKVERERFIELMNIYPPIAISLSRTLIERLNEANSIIERLGTMDGPERVSNYLKALAMREGVIENGLYRLPRKPTYRSVSQRLGLSEKTVYRAVHSLMESGAVSVRNGVFYVREDLVTGG